MRYIGEKRMIYLITSAAQLNFFDWAHKDKILDYCDKHVQEITDHYNYIKYTTETSNGKRRRLSEMKTSGLTITKAETLIECSNKTHKIIIGGK